MIPSISLRRALLAASLCALLFSADGCKRRRHHQTVEDPPDYSGELHTLASGGTLPAMRWPDFREYGKPVGDFYDNYDWDIVWSDNGRPTHQAQDMILNFQHANDRGLIPSDYDAWRWPARVAALRKKDAHATAEFDVEMTVLAMRFISDLHVGRVNPQHFSFGVNIDQKKYDLAEYLRDKVIDGDVNDALNAAEPQSSVYAATKQVLAQYVSLLPQDHTQAVPEVVGKSIEPGKLWSGSQAMAGRLLLFGDLQSMPETVSAAEYDPQLADALKHFQHRHGIDEDGKIGKDTVVALNTPLGVRINQLTDSLERWRWLSDEYQNARLLVNLPEFVLHAYAGDDHHEEFTMRVVVGQSVPAHRTPVITDHMRYINFRPYWNVPISIVRREMVPKIRANGRYLAEHNFETVDAKGNAVNASLEQIARGGVIVRERPGPRNSLGLVKFMFPNQFNVYLHSTPAPEIFERTKRDFSHGCIRLQEPEKLATWLLSDQSKWTPDAVHDAMVSGQDNKTVLLTKPVPIVIFYATAFVPGDGQIHFFNDTYGYDAMLEEALRHGPPYPQQPVVPKMEATE